MIFRLLICLVVVLSGCTSLKYDDSYTSIGQDSRVQYIVLHYTSTDLARSLKILTEQQVSSHYLIAEQPATVYRLVDENNRAWHAGQSEWQGRTWLNSSSIGIEMVNRGFVVDAQGKKHWQPWSEPQIEALIVLLKDIMQRHNLSAKHIVGHSDIAPQRKLDPGPLFPWHRLAQEGLILWPDPQRVAQHARIFSSQLPTTAWFQDQLAKVGYKVPRHGKLDKATQNVLAAFQMKYRPQVHNGQPDAKTAAMLLALNES